MSFTRPWFSMIRWWSFGKCQFSELCRCSKEWHSSFLSIRKITFISITNLIRKASMLPGSVFKNSCFHLKPLILLWMTNTVHCSPLSDRVTNTQAWTTTVCLSFCREKWYSIIHSASSVYNSVSSALFPKLISTTHMLYMFFPRLHRLLKNTSGQDLIKLIIFSASPGISFLTEIMWRWRSFRTAYWHELDSG
jgi:hypothetical protein